MSTQQSSAHLVATAMSECLAEPRRSAVLASLQFRSGVGFPTYECAVAAFLDPPFRLFRRKPPKIAMTYGAELCAEARICVGDTEFSVYLLVVLGRVNSLVSDNLSIRRLESESAEVRSVREVTSAEQEDFLKQLYSLHLSEDDLKNLPTGWNVLPITDWQYQFQDGECYVQFGQGISEGEYGGEATHVLARNHELYRVDFEHERFVPYKPKSA